MRLDLSRARIPMRQRTHSGHVRSQNKAQCIDAMNPDIADWTSAGERRIVNPRPRAVLGRVRKLRVCELRFADAALGDPLADEVEAAVVAHVLRHAEADSSRFRRG